MGIQAGAKQSRGIAVVNSTTANDIFHEYNTDTYAIVGSTTASGAGDSDAFVARYTASNGSLLYQRTFGGSGTEVGNSVYQDTSGNLYITGSTTSSGAGGSDAFIVKYNSTGTIQWQRTFGGSGTEVGTGIWSDGSNVWVGGTTTSVNAGRTNGFFIKYDTNGTLSWQRILSSAAGNEFVTSVTNHPNQSQYIVAGNTIGSSLTARSAGFVMGFDTSGNLSWSHTYWDNVLDCTISDIFQNISENVPYFTGNRGSSIVYLTKLTAASSPSITWQRQLTASTGTVTSGAVSLNRINIAYATISGTTSSSGSFLATWNGYNSNPPASFYWQRLLPAGINKFSFDINNTNAGSRDQIYACGSTSSSFINPSATSIKLDYAGNNVGSFSPYYSYSTTSLFTESIGGLGQYGQYVTPTTGSLTSSTPTLTSSTSTLTNTTVTPSGAIGPVATIGDNTSAVSGSFNNIGQYTIHQFTSNGTFIPSSTGFVDVLAVGAGGSAGPGATGGGGGAGGTLYRKFVPVTSGTSYSMSIGTTNVNGSPLRNTIFNAPGVGISSITVFGGGDGGAAGVTGFSAPLASGGGGGSNAAGGTGAGTIGVGFPGGTGPGSNGGGGGGTGSVGGINLGGSGVPIGYFTTSATDFASAGGSGFPGPGITSTSFGSGGSAVGPTSTPSGRPGSLYIRYI
jgi:hypothetical protein